MQRNSGMPGTHQACAACKHQRKKCSEKCILAPYFPADRCREFQAVHKVFGVSNVQKIVRSLLNEEDRKRAADSLVWEAACRQKDPVLGPYGEYMKVYDELKLYKSQLVVAHPNSSIYRSGAVGLIGWTGTTNGTLSSKNVSHTNGNSIIDSDHYGYGSRHLHGMVAEKARHDGEIAGSMVSPRHQLINGFNQRYYLSGN
ncbi:hypothetical protein Nepgr_012925 [Nepenthes gracilis]|uniref:LOB domain-containing protein n=1 Tax=Nepenthes gracilis TaxID=150966 RepID=A0AAD3XNM6_NEPGR|nr:hypothetical protein Nepgr_012925 [Nepenthes gracilis]